MPVPSLESSLPWVLIDGSTAIEEDIPCRQCSYNLRGIDCTGRCPECGAPAELSIHGDLLRHSDPALAQKTCPRRSHNAPCDGPHTCRYRRHNHAASPLTDSSHRPPCSSPVL